MTYVCVEVEMLEPIAWFGYSGQKGCTTTMSDKQLHAVIKAARVQTLTLNY